MPNPLIPASNYGSSYSVDSGMVITPLLVNSYSALTIPAFKRAVEFLSTNLASFGRSVHKDGSPAPSKHPLDKLLRRRPNAYQNSFTFWQTLYAHTFHRGNGFAQIEWTSNNRPLALNNMLPEDICPFRYDRGDGNGVQQYYVHRPTKTVLPGSDVLHLRSGMAYDGMTALDPVVLHEGVFQRAGDLSRYQTLYIQKGTNIRGTIEFPAGVTSEQVAEVQSILQMYFRGASAERDVLVLPEGATFKNTTITPADSELSKQESSLTKQIAQLMGVAPEFLYEQSESKYNNSVEQAGQNVVRYTFRPLIEQFESELSSKLLSEAELDAGFDISINPGALLRGSTKEQEDIVGTSVNSGIRTRNEGRALLDLPPDKDPSSDKLKTLGDTAAPPTPAEKTNTPLPPKALSAPTEVPAPKPDAFSALAPVIEAACARVDRKTEKALETYSKKSGEERTIAVNVFAESQARYAEESLTPVSESIVAMGGVALPVVEIGQKYAALIRKHAASGEAISLRGLLDKSMG